MTEDITQRLRVTMPTFKGFEISCPCAVRSALMEEAAAEIERLRAALQEATLAAHGCAQCRDEIGRICREALEAKP